MLTWLADNGPFAATEANILFALSCDDFDEEALRVTLRQLKAQSVIVFRRFNNTYAIWQGSDVDIDAQVAQAEQRLAGVFSLAQAVQVLLSEAEMGELFKAVAFGRGVGNEAMGFERGDRMATLVAS